MNKEKTRDLIIKIILIIIIVILLIHNFYMLKKIKNEKTPIGNVDIIEINCNKDDRCNIDNDKKKDETIPVDGDDNELIVSDNDGISWNGSTNVKIFSNSMYTLNDKIAPESSNTYQFIVKNSTNYDLKYVIKFVEDNPNNINMKYKLKKNNSYIVDNYISLSELNISPAILNQSGSDTYYLEWKWISSDNDTKIGKTANASYELKIEIRAESTNG